MTTFTLPYPEYSWSLSQHMGRATRDPRIIYSLLEGASLYGTEEGYPDKITQYVIGKDLIPRNVRGPKPQIWRDYQQVLVELGLIVSTKHAHERVIVTRIGLMLLDGLLGIKEMLTTQALRYQYPNGYKIDLPRALRRNHVGAGVSRLDMDYNSGVLIKPAALILRVLLELAEKKERPYITSHECVLALVPARKNSDWPSAMGELLNIRSKLQAIKAAPVALRHVQEWFGLLGATDIFKHGKGEITLSDAALSDIAPIWQLCKYHENVSTFWYPPQGDINLRASSWFSHFGSPTLQSQWLIPNERKTIEYIAKNYPEGIDSSDEEDGYSRDYSKWNGKIRTTPYPGRSSAEEEAGTAGPKRDALLDKDMAERMAKGIARREKSTRLHEYIVSLVANRLGSAGYTIAHDPQSVDILATKRKSQSILEIKTVTRRNLIQRIRLGVGQLAEYRYRYEIHSGNRAKGVLVLSSDLDMPVVLTDFLGKDIKLGLVGLDKDDKFICHTVGEVESVLSP